MRKHCMAMVFAAWYPFSVFAGTAIGPAAGTPHRRDGEAQAAINITTATIAEFHAAVDAGWLTDEKLVHLQINRIAAYDKRGPAINTVINTPPLPGDVIAFSSP